MQEQFKHYTDQELIDIRNRSQVEADRLQNNIDEMMDESLDLDQYDLLWLNEFKEEQCNEHTEYCMKATQDEICLNVVRLINIELKRRNDEQ